jgi:hypothetical protein
MSGLPNMTHLYPLAGLARNLDKYTDDVYTATVTSNPTAWKWSSIEALYHDRYSAHFQTEFILQSRMPIGSHACSLQTTRVQPIAFLSEVHCSYRCYHKSCRNAKGTASNRMCGVLQSCCLNSAQCPFSIPWILPPNHRLCHVMLRRMRQHGTGLDNIGTMEQPTSKCSRIDRC